MPFVPADAPQWYDFIGRFDAAASSFYSLLDALQSAPAGQSAEYDSVVVDAQNEIATIRELQSLRDQAESWVNFMGNAYYQSGGLQMSGLGIAPIPLIGTIAAALAAIYYLETLVERMATVYRALSTGEPLESDSHGALYNISVQPWGLIALAIAAIFLGPPIIKAIMERGK
jgi:hypothetical protein